MISHQMLTFAFESKINFDFCMERKLIESIVHGIVKQNLENAPLVLDGIALMICRHNRKEIRLHLDNKQFDFENLFADGSFVIKRMEAHVPEEQLQQLKDNFADTAEVLLEYVQTGIARFFTQQGCLTRGVSSLLLSFLKVDNSGFVYNPFGGDVYAPQRRTDVHFLADVMSLKESRYVQLVLASKGLLNMHSRPVNPFMRPEDENAHYDRIYIPAMPFGIRIAGMGRKMEENFILRMIDILIPNGRLVVLLPTSALSGDLYFELRKTLIEKRYLRQVVLFGAGVAYSFASLKTAAFVIEKSQSDSPYFQLIDTTSYDLASDKDQFMLLDRINNNDWSVETRIEYNSLWNSNNLQIIKPADRGSRIERPGYKYLKLRDVLSQYRNPVELYGDEMVPRLSGKDMHINLPSYIIDVQDVEVTKARGRFTCIKEQVFCFHGITQNFLWCQGENDLPIFCNSDIYTFKIKHELISPEYLCFVLHEEDVAADIRSRAAGSTIQRVSREAFLDVEIPIPDRETKAQTVQEMYHFISDRKSRLAKAEAVSHKETIDDIKDDIEDKIHLMGPYNLDIQSGINRILKRLENGEKLDAGSKIFNKSDVTLANYLRQLLSKSVSAGYITASIGGNIFENVERPLDSFLYLQEYVSYLQSDNAYKDISFILGPIPAPYALMITQRSLNLVLDTIVRNAVMHGFTDSFYGEKKIWINISEDTESKTAVLSVANNGLPADENFSEDLYERKFGKCGETAHTGRGGFFVGNAMKFYKGSVSVDTTDKEWPFIVKLHIPMSYE